MDQVNRTANSSNDQDRTQVVVAGVRRDEELEPVLCADGGISILVVHGLDGLQAAGDVRPDEVDVPGDRAGPADDPDIRHGVHRHLDGTGQPVLAVERRVRTEGLAQVERRAPPAQRLDAVHLEDSLGRLACGAVHAGAQGVTRGTGGGAVAFGSDDG